MVAPINAVFGTAFPSRSPATASVAMIFAFRSEERRVGRPDGERRHRNHTIGNVAHVDTRLVRERLPGNEGHGIDRGLNAGHGWR